MFDQTLVSSLVSVLPVLRLSALLCEPFEYLGLLAPDLGDGIY